MAMDDSITVSVDVTNSGKRDGEEVVQMYIHDVAASTIHPIKELKGFEKIMILSGETETITFTITKKTLSFYGADEIFKAEPGTFEVMVGGNSIDLQTKEFVLR